MCVGGAVAPLDGEADLILPLLPLLFTLFFELLLLLEGTSLLSVCGGHGGVAACSVLLQSRAPLWMRSAGVLQPLAQREERHLILAKDVDEDDGLKIECADREVTATV